MLQLAGLAVNLVFHFTARLDDHFMRLNNQQSDKLQHKDKVAYVEIFRQGPLPNAEKHICKFFSLKPLQDVARYTDHADVLEVNLRDEIHCNYKRAILLVLPPEL